jgi:uncharacterized protein
MRDYRDAKAMAQSLRTALSEKDLSIKQSESLEMIARILGAKDWNTLSAAIRNRAVRTPPSAAAPGSVYKPATLPAVPVRDFVIFPRMTAPLSVGRERTIAAVGQAMKGDGRILLVVQKRPADEEPDADALGSVGVVARILHIVDTEEGYLMLMVRGEYRAKIGRIVSSGKVLHARVTPIAELPGKKAEVTRLSEKVRNSFHAYAQIHNPGFQLSAISQRVPAYLADSVASWLKVPVSEKQQILEMSNVGERLAKVAALIEQDIAAP